VAWKQAEASEPPLELEPVEALELAEESLVALEPPVPLELVQESAMPRMAC